MGALYSVLLLDSLRFDRFGGLESVLLVSAFKGGVDHLTRSLVCFRGFTKPRHFLIESRRQIRASISTARGSLCCALVHKGGTALHTKCVVVATLTALGGLLIHELNLV